MSADQSSMAAETPADDPSAMDYEPTNEAERTRIRLTAQNSDFGLMHRDIQNPATLTCE